MYGELIPLGGGDPIPLLKKTLLVGRRESCDIVLRFSNVSAHHCEFTLNSGYWFVKDLNSRNGVKVNGARIGGNLEKRVDPGDTVAIAKHTYKINYSPADNGAVGPPPPDTTEHDIFSKSLLERAGLTKTVFRETESQERNVDRRYDVSNDQPDQIRKRNKPI